MSSQVSNEGLIPHQCGGSLEDQKLIISPGNQSMDEGGLSIEKCEMSDIHRAKKSSPKKMSAFKRFFRWKPEVEPLTPTSDVPSSPIDRGSFKYENDVPAIDHNSSYSNFFGLGDASRNVLGPHGKPDSPKSFDSPKRLIPDSTSSGENADYEVQFAVVAADIRPAETIFTITSDVEGYLDNKNIPKQRYVVTDDEDDLKLTDDIPLVIAAASESSHQMPINIVESDDVCLDISVDKLVDDDCRENEPDAQLEIRPRRRSISNAVVPDNVSDVASHLSIAETFSYETDAASRDSHPDVISAERIEPGCGEDCDGQGVLSTTLGTSSQMELAPEEKIPTAPSLACETLPSSIALTIPQADIRCPVSSPSEEILKKEIKEVVEEKVSSPQAHIDDKCAINREKISPCEVVQGIPKRVDRHAFLSFGNLRFSTAQVPKIIPEEKPPTPICIGRVINGISLAEVEARCKPRFIQPVFTSNEDASFDDDSEGEGGESPRDNCVEQSAAAVNDNEDEKDEAQVGEEVDQEASSARQSEMLLASLKSARFAKRLDYLKVVDRLNQTKATHVVAGESMENTGELPRPHVDDTKIIKDTCDAEVTKTVYKLTTIVVPKVYNKPNSPLCSPGARPVKLVNIIAATATETADTVDSNIIDPAVEDASKTIDLQIPPPENKIEVEVEVQAEVDVYREVQKSSVSNFSIFARLFSPKSSICCTGGMSAGPCYSPFVESAGVDGEKNTITVTSETAGEDGYKSNSDGEEPSGI